MHAQPSIPDLPATAETHPTRQRLLDAAQRVCTERGLHGATTREIADAARVNEVTLFRHFGSKEKLIAALFQRSVAAQTESFSGADPDGNDLPRDLTRYAERLNRILFDHEALIRTMIGESRRYPDQARQVICDAIKPMKQRLGDYLRAAQKVGSVRKNLDLGAAMDAFSGMLLSGMLKRTGFAETLGYDQEKYVATVVDLFLRGIAADKTTAQSQTLGQICHLRQAPGMSSALDSLSFSSPLAQRAREQGWLKWAIALTVSLGAILEVIDVSIVNVALTPMQGNLGATLSEIGWVITGYGIANVVIIPLTAWLDDYFGRKTYFVFSLVAFTIASILCGMATSLPMLIFSRVLQGLGGGSMLGKAQSILFQTFSKEEQGTAQAVFGLGVIVGPAIGPTLGGYLTDMLNWRWIFFINIPFGIVAIILALTFLPDDDKQRRKPPSVDWTGIALLTAGLACLQTLLEEGQQDDWFDSRFISAMAAISFVSLSIFTWWELRIEHPAVDLRVLRYRSVLGGSLYSIVLGAGLYGALFAIPIFTQNYLHFTATQTGELLIPGAITSGVAMILTGKLVGKFDPRLIVAAGALVTSGVIVLPVVHQSRNRHRESLLAAGLSRPRQRDDVSPAEHRHARSLPKHEIPAASGFYNLTRQLGGSLGVAILTTMLSRRESVHRAHLVEYISPLSTAAAHRLQMITGYFQKLGSSAHEARSAR